MEESEAFPLGFPSDVLWARLSLASLVLLWSRSVHHFNLSCRQGLARIVLAMPIRVMTDLDLRATVLSVDGVGAYDHVLRSSMLGKLMEVPQLRPLIPFVRSTYAHPTSYEWEDQHGTRHQVWQHEGGEQGDPLMPLLFCLAVHNALVDIQEQLRPGGIRIRILG